MIVYDKEKWEAFLALLDRPVQDLIGKPRLRKLLQEPSVLESINEAYD